MPPPNIELTFRDGGTGDAGDPYTGLDRFGRLVETLWKQPWKNYGCRPTFELKGSGLCDWIGREIANPPFGLYQSFLVNIIGPNIRMVGLGVWLAEITVALLLLRDSIRQAIPIVEHEDIGPRHGAAVRAGGQRRPGAKGGFIHCHRGIAHLQEWLNALTEPRKYFGCVLNRRILQKTL